MKKVNFFLSSLIFSVAILILSCSMANAQSSKKLNTSASSPRVQAMSDTAFISKNIMDNFMEIQVSQLGVTKSTDPKIKSMAQLMVADHIQMLDGLKKVASNRNMTTMAGGNMSSSNGGLANGNSTGRAGKNSGNMSNSTGSSTTGNGHWNADSGSGTTGSTIGTAGSSNKRSGNNNTATSGSTMGTTGNGSGTTSGSTIGTTGSSSDSTMGTGTLGRSTRDNKSGSTTDTSSIGTTVNGSASSGITGISDSSVTNSSSSKTSGSSNTGMGTGTMSSSQGGYGKNMPNDMSGNFGMGGQDMATMRALQNASGEAFNTMFVSQMLAMHEAKLAELQTAAVTLLDPELKLLVTKAIPKIRMHRDMLLRMNKGTNSGTHQ